MKTLKNTLTKYNYLAMIIIASLIVSCQSEFAKVIPNNNEEEDIDVVYGDPKVLLLIVDGARGQSVSQANTPNLTQLTNNAVYSYYSLSEEESLGIANNWADIFTGVRKEKHKVEGNDFSNSNFALYPIFFTRIKEKYAESKFKMYSSSQVFLSQFGQLNEKEIANTDEEVVTKLKSALNDDDITVATGHFSNINEVGNTVGYDNSFPRYKTAIETFDTQVGELVASIKARKNFSKENWLIIVTSSQGGEFQLPPAEDDNTIFSSPAYNTFTIFSALKYKQRFIGKPFIGNKIIGDFIRLNDRKVATLKEGDNRIYNLGDDEFTVELKVKKNRGPNNNYRFNYASLVGKRDYWQGSWQNDRVVRGWVIYLEDDYWMFNGAGDGAIAQVKGGNLNRASWNTITAVGFFKDGKRHLKTFTNGILNTEADISSWGNLDTDALFKVGGLPGNSDWKNDVYINDVRVWKKALPDELIQQFSCEVGVDPRHPYIGLLAGNWFMANPEGSDRRIIIDESPMGGNLELGGTDYQINRLNDYICAPSVDDLGLLVPRNPDIAAQIYSWLKVPRQVSWQMDGRVWLDK